MEKGYEIAKSNNELKGIAEEIRHHHERWDGNGYPDGLSCESIPLLSRVIAVVDAFDAMINDRAYRPAMSVSDAMEELKRCAGTQFDPYIVSEFLSMLKEHPEYIQDHLNKPKTFSKENNSSQQLITQTDTPESFTVHPVLYSRYVLNESMRIVSVDENFETLTGYTAEDIQNTYNPPG